MKAVQSLWTGTPRLDVSRESMMLHTLALCYLRNHFDHVEFVTDSPGLVIADRLRWPYDSFTTHLDHVPRQLSHIWAAGKLHAQLAQSEPYFHVDNDLLFFDAPRQDVRRARVAVHGKDEIRYYRSHPLADRMCAVAGIDPDVCPYNCGFVGGNDWRFLHGYAKRALEAMHAMVDIEEGSGVSIFAEQLVFGEICREEKVRPVELIPMPLSARPHDMFGHRITHLYAWTKKEPRYVALYEKRFRDEFPNEFRDFERGFPFLEEVLSHPRRAAYFDAYRGYGVVKPRTG